MSDKPSSGHFSGTSGDKAHKDAIAKKNKQNHILGQSKHKFGSLIDSFNGDKNKTFDAIQDAANKVAQKLPDGITTQKVKINGIEVTIKGFVKDKKFYFGTSYIEGE